MRVIIGMFVLLLVPWPTWADVPVRLATWNVQGVGAPGSAGFEAAAAVLARINPAVVGLQEVASDADEAHLLELGRRLGLMHYAIAPAGPFGAARVAVLSRWPIVQARALPAAVLSGDATANDVTRYILLASVDVTGRGDVLHAVVVHLKSGFNETDEFRRTVEALRTYQATATVAAADALVIMGDLNADISDPPPTPARWAQAPAGDLPGGFSVGADVRELMASGTLINDPFFYLRIDAEVLDARQANGSDATRPASGRRIDYVLVNAPMAQRAPVAQVYACEDQPQVCETASDHLPVLADVVVPTGGAGLPPELGSAAAREAVQKAYIAYYGRPADPQGLNYWAQRLDAEGGNLRAIIDAFGQSGEFVRRYGALGANDLVAGLYQQLFGRTPDADGQAFYVRALTTGSKTLQAIALDVLYGAQNNDIVRITHKYNAAAYFTQQVRMGCSYGTEQAGVQYLGAVTDAASLVQARQQLSQACNR